MQTVGAKVQVGTDRKVTLQLPDTLPEGEYEIVLVLNSSTKSGTHLSTPTVEEKEGSMTERWSKWFEEVDQLPLPEKKDVKGFGQHLIEKYRQQGLEL